MNTTIKILGGILLGAALGTAAGLLIAPLSVKKTLKTLGRKSKSYKKQIGAAVASYLDDARSAYNGKVDTYAKNGKSSIDTVKDSVKI